LWKGVFTQWAADLANANYMVGKTGKWEKGNLNACAGHKGRHGGAPVPQAVYIITVSQSQRWCGLVPASVAQRLQLCGTGGVPAW